MDFGREMRSCRDFWKFGFAKCEAETCGAPAAKSTGARSALTGRTSGVPVVRAFALLLGFSWGIFLELPLVRL